MRSKYDAMNAMLEKKKAAAAKASSPPPAPSPRPAPLNTTSSGGEDESSGTEGVSGSGSETDSESNTIPLTNAEIRLWRSQFKKKPLMMNATPHAEWLEREAREEKFKVPKKHPVFDGADGQLEGFIMDMELEHQTWVLGSRASEHCPDFFSKLGAYFKEGTPAKRWFQLYAREQVQKKAVLSWNNLKESLRRDFGALDRPDKLYERFWDMAQEDRSVQDYISIKKHAALMCGDALLPKVYLWGFIRGLNADIKAYVKLQRVDTLEEAQLIALKFEESQPRIKANHKTSRVKSKAESNSSDKKRRMETKPTTPRNSAARQEAVEKIKKMRTGRCFGCGEAGHIRENCTATEDTKQKFQNEFARIKRIASMN
jgi:hypothetical protein